MNKIILENDSIKKLEFNSNISIEEVKCNNIFGINAINITIKKNVDLFIDYIQNQQIKSCINIHILEGVNANIDIYMHGIGGKIKFNYNIEKNALCKVNQLNDTDALRQQVIVNLLQEQANMDYNFKSVATQEEMYDFLIHHEVSNTISNIKNNGVCIKDGSMIIAISGTIPSHLKNCICNQQNRIINLTNHKCEIKPNLYIDSNDIIANHAALIGKFSEEEIFYMLSRGIDYNSVYKLLMKGFLNCGFNDQLKQQVDKIIELYWR